MIGKEDIINKAYELDFGDIGFTTADPFDTQRKLLQKRQREYGWSKARGLDLMAGTDPVQLYPDAKTIIVLIENYFKKAFPPALEKHFGRCYLNDDRMTRDGLSIRVKAFRTFLTENGVRSTAPSNLPHRLSAARAGLGTFGKNCLFYSRKLAYQGSWVFPIALICDHEFPPDEPTLEVGCPDWCRNACMMACPTHALKAPRHIDPAKCISYLTYYGEGITPLELREPMGMWVYGCDRCQNVCPRNVPWLAKTLPENEKVARMSKDFQLDQLLKMDKEYYNSKIRPHMFYVTDKDLWRWKMNAARAMGNSRDDKHIPDLLEAFKSNDDERVLGMIAWAVGRIGGVKTKKALHDMLIGSAGSVREEISHSLEIVQLK